jgi:hypothetical protein
VLFVLFEAKITETDPKLSLEGKTQSRSPQAGQEGGLGDSGFYGSFAMSHHGSNFLSGMVRTVWRTGPGRLG